MATATSSFDIREHLDKLTPAKTKGRYTCPACQRNNLTIASDTGKYQCWSGCDCKDIREAISPWKSDAKGASNPIGSRKPKPKAKPPKSAPIPEGSIELAKLPEPVTHPEKRKCGEHRIETEYPYSDRHWVLRVDTLNPDNPKGHDKQIIPHHVNTEGKLSKGKGGVQWNPYRIEEVQTYGAGKWVLGVEGESCVETARELGIAAFTLDGSSWTEAAADNVIVLCKAAGVIGVAYFPDHDDTGYKKAKLLADAAAKAQLPFVFTAANLIWSEIGDKQDIADWVAWGMTQGWDREEFIRRLEEAFNLAVEDEAFDKTWEANLGEDGDDEDAIRVRKQFTQIVLELLYGDKPWICANDKLYYWTGTHYKYSEDDVEKRRIRDFCDTYHVVTKADSEKVLTFPYAKPGKVDEIFKWVKLSLLVSRDSINPPGLNCTNGVLQIEWNVVEVQPVPSWRLIEHSPELHYIYEPLVKYDPEANEQECSVMLEALDTPQRDIFLKTIAASLDLKTIRKHKGRLVRCLLLKGHGNNGKDTLREAVSMIYGHQGMTGCTLSDFAMYDEGRKFPLARLRHTRVNWASENANTTRLDKIQSLKAFITGDTLSAEGKGKDENEFVPAGIAIFNINDTPKLQGTLEAIASRYGVLTFSKTFKIGADLAKGELEADPRFKYDPSFLQEEVLPAFLNRVLDAFQRLMTEGINYDCTQQALEDIQAENSHLFQFCQDTGLGYDPHSYLTAGEIWERLEEWYQDNGTLEYEESTNGKRKAIWSEQANPYDRNVKGENQVLARFHQLFPKCKREAVSHSSGKRKAQALKGLGFSFGTQPPNGDGVQEDKCISLPASICDNGLESPTPVLQIPTPIPHQSPHQKITENQGFHTSHTSFPYSAEKNEIEGIDSSNATLELLEQEISAQNLVCVVCDDGKSSTLGVGDWCATGVGICKTGVEVSEIEEEALEVTIEPEALGFEVVCDNEPLQAQGQDIEEIANLSQQAELPIYQRGDGGFGVASERLNSSNAIAPQPTAVEEEEKIAALAMVLADNGICPGKEELATIRRLYSPANLNAACKRLSPERHAQISKWVVELNHAIAQAKQEPEKANPIRVGSRVRYTYSHSKRCGMVGVVKKITGSLATVRLDYHGSISSELRELTSTLKDLELIDLER